MASENETIADIVAQMRDPEGMGYTVGNTANGADISEDTAECMATFADRIEAAWKREKAEAEAGALAVGGIVEAARKKPVGNSAAHAMTLDEAIAHAEDVAGKCDTSCKREHRQLADWLKELRDVKSQPVGNAAALREALDGMLILACGICANKNGCEDGRIERCGLVKKARAALSAPPRNCDIYPTNEDSWRSYQLSHAKNADAHVVPDFIDWLFAPAEKGADA